MKKVTGSKSVPNRRPALSPETREMQMISYAYDLVEQRLLNGTATSQETTHFLKLGSAKAQLELEKLRKENALLSAKEEQIKSEQRSSELLEAALKAFKSYSGNGGDSDDED